MTKPPEPNRRLDVTMAGAIFEADNGYRFAALPEPGSSVIRVDVRYPVGSADDPPGKEGLAHLVEHLLFEGVFKRANKTTTLSAELGRIALSSNAATYRDYTDFETVVARAELEDVMELEVERMIVGCDGLTPSIVAREREVVLDELRQNAGPSGPAIARAIDEQIYPAGHPYRRVDTIESVSKLELADVCAFLAGPYKRGKAFVVASGDLDGTMLQNAASKYFGNLPRRDVSAHAHPAVAQANAGSVTVPVDVDQPTLVVLFPLPPQSSRDYRLLELSMYSIAERLESFAIEFGWGTGASSEIIGGAYAPVLAVSVGLRGKTITSEIRDAVERAAQNAPRVVYRTGDDRASPQWKRTWQGRAGSLLAEWDSLAGRNGMMGDFLQFDADESFLIGRLGELDKAEPSDAHKVASTYLDPARARYVLLLPTGQAGSKPVLTYSGGAASHGIHVDGRLADVAIDVPANTDLALPVQRYALDNGLSVVLWPAGNSPLVSGRLVVDSGAAHDPIGREGVSRFSGADDIGLDHLVFSDREIAPNVDELVKRLGFELRDPGYDVSDSRKTAMTARMKSAHYRERVAFALDVMTALYGKGHPYARPAMTEASLAGLGHDAIAGWAREHLVGKNATLVFAGKFDADLVKKHIAYNVDQISAGGDSADIPKATPQPATIVTGTSTAGDLTVSLTASFVRGSGIDANYAKRLVLEAVLGAQLAHLRETSALTYGFGADYEPLLGGGRWSIGGAADASRAGEAMTALLATLAAMRADPESYREAFVLGRQKVLERLLVGTRSSAAVANRLAFLARFDLPDGFYGLLASSIAGTKLASFHEFLVAELDPAHRVLGVYGTATPVAAAVAAAK